MMGGNTKSIKQGLGGVTSSMVKEVPTRYHCGQIPQTVSGNPTCWGALLKCLYTNALSMGNKHDELEIHMQLQSYDLVGITETWWDGSHDWSVAMKEYSLYRKDRKGRQGVGVALYVRKQLECIELSLGMDKEPTESLWVRIKERTGTGDMIMGVCYRPSDQEKQVDEAER